MALLTITCPSNAPTATAVLSMQKKWRQHYLPTIKFDVSERTSSDGIKETFATITVPDRLGRPAIDVPPTSPAFPGVPLKKAQEELKLQAAQ